MESTLAIVEMILQEAQKSGRQIIQEAQKSAEDILEKQRRLGVQEASELAQSILGKAHREAEVEKMRNIANAKIKANWVILSKRQRMIDTVLREAENQLRTLTKSKEYLFILEKLIIEGGIFLGGRELEVALNEKDSTQSITLEKLAEEISERTGFETKLKLSADKIEVMGGAVVRKSDGKVVMDNTFDDILLRKARELRSKIAKILFKETTLN